MRATACRDLSILPGMRHPGGKTQPEAARKPMHKLPHHHGAAGRVLFLLRNCTRESNLKDKKDISPYSSHYQRHRMPLIFYTKKHHAYGMPAYPTFPRTQGPKYHRVCALSLLCSEWEEVGHTQIKHRQTAHMVRLFILNETRLSPLSFPRKRESSLFTKTKGLDSHFRENNIIRIDSSLNA